MNPERMYDIILSPVVTEKSTMGSENDQVTFKVTPCRVQPQRKQEQLSPAAAESVGGSGPLSSTSASARQRTAPNTCPCRARISPSPLLPNCQFRGTPAMDGS